GKCNSGNPCEEMHLGSDGNCQNTPRADGAACTIGVASGACVAGTCNLVNLDCNDGNQCTHDMATATGCAYASEPASRTCVGDGHAGTCEDGFCNLGEATSAAASLRH